MSFSLSLKEKNCPGDWQQSSPLSSVPLLLWCQAVASLLMDHQEHHILILIAMTELAHTMHTSLNSDFSAQIPNTSSVPGKIFQWIQMTSKLFHLEGHPSQLSCSPALNEVL